MPIKTPFSTCGKSKKKFTGNYPEMEFGKEFSPLFDADGTRWVEPEHTTLIAGDIGVPGVSHFIYKSRVQVQFTMPSLPSNDRQARRLLALYRHLHAVVHTRKTHVKLFHYMSRRYSALVWVGSGFECYAVAEGKVGRGVLARGARGVVRWVRTEEARLFVSGGVVF